MDDNLLRQFIAGEYVTDIWNHLRGNAVTIVYEKNGRRRRMLIGVEREDSIQPGQFYRSATVLCTVGGDQRIWGAESESMEKSIALTWDKAQTELLHALENGIEVVPVFDSNPDILDRVPSVIWQHRRDSD